MLDIIITAGILPMKMTMQVETIIIMTAAQISPDANNADANYSSAELDASDNESRAVLGDRRATREQPPVCRLLRPGAR